MHFKYSFSQSALDRSSEFINSLVLQEAQRAAKQARQAAQKSGQPLAVLKTGKTSTGTASGVPPPNAVLTGTSPLLTE